MTDDYGIPTGPINDRPQTGASPDRAAALFRELIAAGVELGEHDRRIVEWLAGWEWSTVATVASWIKRAHS